MCYRGKTIGGDDDQTPKQHIYCASEPCLEVSSAMQVSGAPGAFRGHVGVLPFGLYSRMLKNTVAGLRVVIHGGCISYLMSKLRYPHLPIDVVGMAAI